MKKATCITLLCLLIFNPVFSQSVDELMSAEKMKRDLEIFKKIRIKANSGLYKYRTKEQIDSIYHWAENSIDQSSSYLDFYNLICQLTDFEGSLHNDTRMPRKYSENLREEDHGYFPYPIKWIDGSWIVNFENKEIPLGSELIEINGIPIAEIIPNLYKYYTTDGQNITGKRVGITYNFGKYYRLNYGLTETFQIKYKVHGSEEIRCRSLKDVSYSEYYKNVRSRYSRPFDEDDYKSWKEEEIYSYQKINGTTGLLTVNSFSLGNKTSPKHLKYVAFLDSVFIDLKKSKLENLIVDIRHNGGGTDPNDLVTYSYLTQRDFMENRQAWISFRKFPYLKYAYTKIPRFLRPLGVRSYNKMFKKEFPVELDGKFYEDAQNEDHQTRHPNENAFTGRVYLLVGPRVASAGSLFAAMLAGNRNTTVIGEETMGGYYGHNGHTPLGYILPNSKIETFFSVVNLEQDVPQKSNQLYHRGIIPDYEVSQSYEDFLRHQDTQMKFTLDLIDLHE